VRKREKTRIGPGARRVWVFQYTKTDDIASVHAGRVYRWQTHSGIRAGDKVVLWKSGDEAGVFGFGEIVAPSVDEEFWGKPISLKFRVSERFGQILAKSDLSKEALLRKLAVMTGAFGAGITAATVAQFERLAQLARSAQSTSYWVFQANPRTGDDLRKFLAINGKIGCWRLTRFKDPRKHVRPGDKVVLWQVEGGEPAGAGVYAIGEITKAPVRTSGVWGARYRLTMVRDLDDPISTTLLRADSVLKEVPAFRKKAAQGSNFRISREQWEAVVSRFSRGASRNGPGAILEPTRQTGESADIALVVGTSAHEMELRERRLVRAYQRYVHRKGSRPRPYTIRLPEGENSLACDLYDKRLGNLIEAKGIVCRESVRMAIGQLADYVRFIEPRPRLAVLLPSRPRPDLEALLKTQGIHAIWQAEDGGFTDNSTGRGFT
jgi:hypothetical protein